MQLCPEAQAISPLPPQQAHLAPATSQVTRQLERPWPWVLIFGFGTQLVLIICVTCLGLSALSTTDTRLHSLTQRHMNSLQLLKEMRLALGQHVTSLASLVGQQEAFQREGVAQQLQQYAARFVQARRELLALPLTTRELELLEQQWHINQQLIPLQQELIALGLAGHRQAAQEQFIQQVIPLQNASLERLFQLEGLSQSLARDAMQEATQVHARTRNAMLWLSLLALVVGLLIAVTVGRRIHQAYVERERLATHDPLTGLPNRTLLLDRLDQAILRSRRQRTLVGLLFIDLDGFKQVNDRLGHAVGDELLRHMATRLSKLIRAGDIVARLGGDEFIIGILDAGSRVRIGQVSDKLLTAIAEPIRIAEHSIALSGSVGICIFPDDGHDAHTLLNCADFAMYAAKDAGKNQIRHYSPELCTQRPPLPYPTSGL